MATSIPDDGARRARREAILVAALLALLTAALHAGVLFDQQSLVLSNRMNPLDYRPLPENYGPEMRPTSTWGARHLLPYGSVQDSGSAWWQWEPAGEFLRAAIADGEWPLWDPYVGGGTPALANLTPAFFFPPFTAVAALGHSVPLRNAYLLLLVWQASFFTFLFLRGHGLTATAAVGGAVAVLVSGAVNQGLGTHMGQAALCLPACLWATRRFVERPARARIAVVAAVYGSTALASFPPILIGVFGVTATYALAAILLGPDARTRRRVGLQWAAVTAVSAGLVAFAYVPALVLRAATPHVAAHYRDAGLETMPLLNGFQLLSPTLMGGVGIYYPPPPRNPDGPHLPYAGALVVLAALLARPRQGIRRALFWASVISGAGILLKVFGVPPVHWIAQVPMLGQFHYAHYIGYALGFVITILAALGLDELMRGRSTARGIAAASSLVLAGSLALFAILSSAGRFDSVVGQLLLRDWTVMMGAAVLGTAVIIAAAAAPRFRKASGVLFVALVATEGAFNSSFPQPRAWDIFSNPPAYVRAIQEEGELERVMTFAALNANLNSAFRIFTLESVMAFNSSRMFALHRRYMGSPQTLFLRESRRLPPEAVLDRAATGLILIRNAFPALVAEAIERGYETRFSDGYVHLFRRPAPPRFFFSSDYAVVDAAAALDGVGSLPSRQILIEESPAFVPQPDTGREPAVTVERYGRNSIRVRVRAPRAGLVYASETFFHGWRASNNGRAVRLLRANYAFSAVAVAAGESTIEFRYWPPGLTAGLSTSAASLLMLALLIAFPFTARATGQGTRPREDDHDTAHA